MSGEERDVKVRRVFYTLAQGGARSPRASGSRRLVPNAT